MVLGIINRALINIDEGRIREQLKSLVYPMSLAFSCTDSCIEFDTHTQIPILMPRARFGVVQAVEEKVCPHGD
jgi:hypothetical protein